MISMLYGCFLKVGEIPITRIVRKSCVNLNRCLHKSYQVCERPDPKIVEIFYGIALIECLTGFDARVPCDSTSVG